LYEFSLFKRADLELRIGFSIDKELIREDIGIPLRFFIEAHLFSKDQKVLPMTIDLLTSTKCILSNKELFRVVNILLYLAGRYTCKPL
jgi:hypothetical protein